MTASAISSFASTDSEAPARRALSIEDALRWAIRDELPKRQQDRPISAPLTSGLHPMWRGAVMGGRVDNWSREPGMPLAMGDPHPDALAIEEALRGLRTEDLDISGYDIGHRLAPRRDVDPAAAQRFVPVLDRAIATVRERLSGAGRLAAHIVTHAIKNRKPDLGGDPEFEPAKGTRGQVTLWLTETSQVGEGADGTPWYVETDMVTTPVRAGQYRPGTFCKLHWTRDGCAIAQDRAEHAIWHAALTELARRVAGTRPDVDANGRPIEVPILRTIRITPPRAPAAPWIVDPPPPRTLLSAVPANPDLDKPRVAALGPAARKGYPVRQIPPAEYPTLQIAA